MDKKKKQAQTSSQKCEKAAAMKYARGGQMAVRATPAHHGRNGKNYSFSNYADRLEAAHKREKAEIEAEALAAGGIVEAERHKPGNAAAMREALDDIIDKINMWSGEGSMEDWQYSQLFDIADAALAEPVRNCDRFANETDAQIAFLNEVWLISVTKETALERDRFENWTDEMRSRYAKWLLVPATEGGSK